MAPGPIVLSSQDDWQIWLNQIKVFANARGVWEYVDPNAPNPKTLIEPAAPCYTDIRPSARSLAELSTDELGRWIHLVAYHNHTMEQFEKVRDRLGEVHMEIIHTVSKDNQRYLIGPEGPRDAVLRLAGELAPRETQPTRGPQDVTFRWRKLQLDTPTDNLDGWLAKWHFLYKEGKAAGIPEVDGKRPLLAFLYVVDKIAPKFAFEWDCKIEEDTSIQLPKLLREFQKWKQLHPDLLSICPEQTEQPEKTGIGPSISLSFPLPAQTSRTPNSEPKRQSEHTASESPSSPISPIAPTHAHQRQKGKPKKKPVQEKCRAAS